jgi:hypothetical protein
VFLLRLDNKMIAAIAKEYKISNADITFREDCNVDQLIDVIEGNVRTNKNSRPLTPRPARCPWPSRHRAGAARIQPPTAAITVSSPCSGSRRIPA